MVNQNLKHLLLWGEVNSKAYKGIYNTELKLYTTEHFSTTTSDSKIVISSFVSSLSDLLTQKTPNCMTAPARITPPTK